MQRCYRPIFSAGKKEKASQAIYISIAFNHLLGFLSATVWL